MQAHQGSNIKWDVLSPLFVVNKGETLKFPIGNCGMIHSDEKNFHRLKNRHYLEEFTCNEEKCIEIIGEKYFSKGKGTRVVFQYLPRCLPENFEKLLDHFVHDLSTTINDFVKTERKKIDQLKPRKDVFDVDLLHEPVIQKLWMISSGKVDDKANNISWWKESHLSSQIVLCKMLILYDQMDSIVYLRKNGFDFNSMYYLSGGVANGLKPVLNDYLAYYVRLNLLVVNDLIVVDGKFTPEFEYVGKWGGCDYDEHMEVLREKLNSVTVDDFPKTLKEVLKFLYHSLINLTIVLEDIGRPVDWKDEMIDFFPPFGFKIVWMQHEDGPYIEGLSYKRK